MNDGIGVDRYGMEGQDNWRHDTTAFDKRKKKMRGCPNCYKKTYVMFELGETCPNCGQVIGTHFFFQSKHQQDENNEGLWIRCTNEETCMKMAEKGYTVKKVVEKPSDTD